MGRISEEKETLLKMIEIYCIENHSTKANICVECSNLKDYAFKRLEHCPFGEKKGSCGKCKVHCYKAEYREMIKKVMRYSGPRMIIHAPMLVLKHWFESLKYD